MDGSLDNRLTLFEQLLLKASATTAAAAAAAAAAAILDPLPSDFRVISWREKRQTTISWIAT